MKRIISLILTLLFVVFLSACRPNEQLESSESLGPTTQESVAPTTISPSTTTTSIVEPTQSSTVIPITTAQPTTTTTTIEPVEEKGVVIVRNILLEDGRAREKTYSYTDEAVINKAYLVKPEAIDGYSYAGYQINDIVQTSDSFIAKEENVIDVYYVKGNYYAVFICDNNAKLIDVQINVSTLINKNKITIANTEAGTRYNQGFELKYTTGNGAVYINSIEVSPSSEFLIVYNGSIMGNPKYGDSLTINTTLKNFTCWKLNGKVYSYSKVINVTYYGPTVFTACADESIIEEPFINTYTIGSKAFAKCEANGYTLIDAGIIENKTRISKAVSSDNSFAVPSLDIECYMIICNDSESKIIYSDASKEEYSGKSYIVTPDGSALGQGTYSSPLNIYSAAEQMNASDTIYLLPGTYNLTRRLNITSTGDKNSYTRIIGIGNVVLDFGIVYDESLLCTDLCDKSANIGVYIAADYVHLKNITVCHAGSKGISINGNNNIVERCIAYENGNTGIQIAGNSGESIDIRPHNNYILNCTSFGNNDWMDTEDPGQDADGFSCKILTGYDNVFDGCISYCNSDDGWDLYCFQTEGKIGPVTIYNCIAFANGYSYTGEALKNGNGFKLGGMAVQVDHYVKNCLAFNNLANGFDDNSNPGTLYITNCTGYNNNSRNFQTGRWVEDSIYTYGDGERGSFPVEKSHNALKNCLSYDGAKADTLVGTIDNSILNYNSAYYLFNDFSGNIKECTETPISFFNPFVSTAIDLSDIYNIDKLMRDADGYIALGDYFKPVEEYKQYGCNLSSGKQTYA